MAKTKTYTFTRTEVNKTYTLAEVNELIEELVKVIKARKSFGLGRPADFVKRHPWVNKYVSPGFAEANQLMELAEQPAFDIVFVPQTEAQIEWRADRKMKPRLIFQTSGCAEHDRIFGFLFEEQEDGLYIALNG